MILQSYWNFPNGLFKYIQACNYSRLKLSFHFYVKRTVHRQEFGAKLSLTTHSDALVVDILKFAYVVLHMAVKEFFETTF